MEEEAEEEEELEEVDMDLMEDDPREAELLQEIDELEAELEAALNSPDEPINNDFENEKR